MVLLLGVVIIADAIEPSKYLNRYKRLEIHRHGQKPTVLHIAMILNLLSAISFEKYSTNFKISLVTLNKDLKLAMFSVC